MDATQTKPDYAGMIDALAERHAQPLWDRYHRITTREPKAPDAPMLWSWREMLPLIERAAREVSMEDAERRVLLLTHPAFGGRVATTTNLSGGLQTLLPGEVARAHRHSLQAIRFVMSGSGAVTNVNRHRCPMAQGDLVLTPAWTWHEHVHSGTERMVWFDGLDLPLLSHLDSMFFEIAGPDAPLVEPAPTRASVAPPGMVLLGPDPDVSAEDGRPNPYCYSWSRAIAALESADAAADGSRWLRYVDGQSRGAVMPTLDCYLQSCAAGRSTRATRSTSNAICVVARGHGSSQIGDNTMPWSQHDVFTVPHWNWVSHTAASDDAVLFVMTDREFLASMGYLRDELGPQ
ncbi:MAG: cupin domain-containing protein [Burkholderiaceae bacterium]